MRKQSETNESSAISLIQRVIKTTKEADKWDNRLGGASVQCQWVLDTLRCEHVSKTGHMSVS